MINIDEVIKQRIKDINWFNNCGNKVTVEISENFRYVNSWEEAKSNYRKEGWEEKTLEAQNELTVFLYKNYKTEYLKWNTITKEAKKFIEKDILPILMAIKEENELDNTFINCVKYDILGAIMEYSFTKCKGRPSFFFELLNIYESGNFPCGYENNTIVIF